MGDTIFMKLQSYPNKPTMAEIRAVLCADGEGAHTRVGGMDDRVAQVDLFFF